MRTKIFILAALLLALATGAFLTSITWRDEVVHVVPVVETEPVHTPGDAADDPAIWRHPLDPSLSTILGTDKDSGLAVYDLSGNELQFLDDGRLNNVGLRHAFPLSGESVDLVTAGNQSDSTIAIYRVNRATRALENVAARKIRTCAPYGSCMYRSPITGKLYYFVNAREGTVEQWELFDNGDGKVEAQRRRAFEVGYRPEGCVADDDYGYLYLGVEEIGIWRFQAEPDAGTEHLVIDHTGLEGHLTAEVEGLAIYYSDHRSGYLIASSQGSNEFVVYRREPDNAYVTSFKIVAGNRIDGVSHTDGIDVASFYLGPRFPKGVFVAQDDSNDGSNQNFKLVSWELIAKAMNGKATR